MLDWGLSYDYTALLLFGLVLLWHMIEKKIPLERYYVFAIFTFIGFFATCTEIMYVSLYNDQGDSIMYQLLVCLNNVCLYSLPVLFALYIFNNCHLKRLRKKFINALTVLLIGLIVVMVALNPVFHWVNTSGNNSFDAGVMGVAMYFVGVLMVVVANVEFLKGKRGNSITSVVMLFIVTIFCVLSAYIQNTKDILIINITLAFCDVIMYHYLQNPGSLVDDTTGLYNRKMFTEYINSLYESDKKFAILLIAMDDFNFINKSYGMDTGDMMLYQTAGFLLDTVDDRNVFRMDSDHFGVVLKDTKKIQSYAEIIHERFKHPWYSESSAGIMMSASICIIECPNDAKDYESLVEVMDYSMSLTKKTQKGGISKSSDFELDTTRNDKVIGKIIKQAMDREELQVYYQPIFSVDKNRYNSAEALVRLHDQELGWISPEVFIPIAEKNGMIIEMGDFILESVCRFIRDNELENTCIEYIEVNISTIQLRQPDFADRFKSIINKYNIKPSQINIEITETATIGTTNVVSENIKSLVEFGIKFSLDDYGSGNANIDYINNMPFSIIKLDKCIIWDAFDNEKAGITLEYTIKMLNALKLYIVAEGVETLEMKDKLESVGCHYMQGWYYSKAVAGDEFMKLIAS